MLVRHVGRRFLELGASGLAAILLSDSIARALAIPARRATRTLRDVEHIVVLMQENRSFDHYFGVTREVRGFGDPHLAILPSGRPVWYQSDGTTVVPPFRPDIGDLAPTFFQDLDPGWNGTHEMFDSGNWDKWLAAKSPSCMAYIQRSDLPFHYALGMRLRYVMPTTARCWGRPIPTATTCGSGGMATTARGAAPSSPTTRSDTAGRPTLSACRQPA